MTKTTNERRARLAASPGWQRITEAVKEETTMKKVDGWTTWATPAVWQQLGIDPARVQEALGTRDVNSQLGNIRGWLRDLGEIDLLDEIDAAILGAPVMPKRGRPATLDNPRPVPITLDTEARAAIDKLREGDESDAAVIRRVLTAAVK